MSSNEEYSEFASKPMLKSMEYKLVFFFNYRTTPCKEGKIWFGQSNPQSFFRDQKYLSLKEDLLDFFR